LRLKGDEGLHFDPAEIAKRRHGMIYFVSIEDVIGKLRASASGRVDISR
jgi:hypothetical protein